MNNFSLHEIVLPNVMPGYESYYEISRDGFGSHSEIRRDGARFFNTSYQSKGFQEINSWSIADINHLSNQISQ